MSSAEGMCASGMSCAAAFTSQLQSDSQLVSCIGCRRAAGGPIESL